jgi:hypothetical protein
MVDAASRLTSTGTVMGTPHYMAPEQLEGTQAGAAADMWSLGATMYAAVEGTLPFDGPTLTAIITAILAREPAPPAHAGPLAAMLGKLLVKDPAGRPEATAIARELRATAAAASAFGGNATPGTAAEDNAATESAPADAAPADATPAPAPAEQGEGVRQPQTPARPVPVATPSHPLTVASPQKGVPATPYPETISAPAPPQPGPRKPWDYPQQPPPGGDTPQPGTPWPYPQPTPTSQPVRVPSQDGLAVAGLILAIVTAVAYIGGLAVNQNPAPGKSAAFAYGADAVLIVVAVIALAARRTRRPLLPYVLGVTFISMANVAYDVLAIPAYHLLSADRSNHAKVSFLANAFGDVVAAIAAVILLMAVRRMFGRGRWAAPRILPALLLAGAVLGPLAWTGVWTNRVYAQDGNDYGSGWGVGKFLSTDYPFAVFIAAGLVVAVIVALCALGLRARPAGGVLLIGWTVNMVLSFGQVITEGWEYPGAAVAGNVVAALLMLATIALAIVYAARKSADPAPPGSGFPPGR